MSKHAINLQLSLNHSNSATSIYPLTCFVLQWCLVQSISVHIRCPKSISVHIRWLNMHFFGLWEQTEVAGENSCWHMKNVQTHPKGLRSSSTTRIFLLWGHSTDHSTTAGYTTQYVAIKILQLKTLWEWIELVYVSDSDSMLAPGDGYNSITGYKASWCNISAAFWGSCSKKTWILTKPDELALGFLKKKAKAKIKIIIKNKMKNKRERAD